MLVTNEAAQSYIYYVCDESGNVLYEYYDEETAQEVANKQEGYSVSRRQLLMEDDNA